MKPDPSAFSDLDQLYTQILSVYPSTVNIVEVMGIISASHGELAEVMEDIFWMEELEGELKLVLRGLSSLIKNEIGEDLDEGIIPHFAHASLGVFKTDPLQHCRHINTTYLRLLFAVFQHFIPTRN